MQLQLSQHRIVQGPKPKQGPPPEALIGLRERLNCEACEARDPGPEAETKRRFGCRKDGRVRIALNPIRIDYTGDPIRDFVSFCPGSVRDPAVIGWLYEAVQIESLGGLKACSGCPGIYHLPERVIDFYTAALAARDRFEAMVSARHAELLGGR